ncbi:hypothetical protein H5410_015689, partial [Solanum commersonii]
MMWDSRVWKGEKGEVLHIGAYSLTCKFEELLQKFSFHITSVFAPNGKVERRLIWDEKGVVRGLLKGPSAICGDFGVCGLQLEKRNCNKRSSAMEEFTNFIEVMELIDTQLDGGHHIVREWWSSFEFTRRPDFILASKLKALKGKLKEWSMNEQGNLKLQKSRLLNEMTVL